MKNKYIKVALSLLLLAGATGARAQTGVGTTSPDPSAQLDVTSLTRGFLPPRVTTAQRDAIASPATGLTVFNVNTGCLEYYVNTAWKSACSANVDAVYTSSTLNCGGALAGPYVAGVAMTSTNTKTVTVTVTSPGDYTISSDTQNGVSFAGAGTLRSVGSGVSIVLTATGAPRLPGNYTYTVTLSGQTCTFVINYDTPPAGISAISCGSASGTYVTGGAATVAHTASVNITPTGQGYYSASTDAVNGLSFSASGAFTPGQVGASQAVTLQASGTPLAIGTFTYTVTVGGQTCSFPVTVTPNGYYLMARVTGAGLVTYAAGTDVAFTSLQNSGVSVSSTLFTLKAGKTYKLAAALHGTQGSTNSVLHYAWVDAANTPLPASCQAYAIAVTYTAGDAAQTTAVAVITVGGSDITVKLRVLDNSGLSTVPQASYATVEEIPVAASYVMARVTGTSYATYAAGTDVAFTSLQNSGVSVSSTLFTLKAGKTYKLAAALHGTLGSTNAVLHYGWVDAGGTPLTASCQAYAIAVTYTAGDAAQTTAVAVITVGGSDITVKLRVLDNSGLPTYGPVSYATVTQLP